MILLALLGEELKGKNKRIEEALKEIADGNRAALGTLYDLIKTDVFAYALSKTGNKSDAEDIMQDTFVKVYRYAKRYEPKGKPMAWVVTIELNLIRAHFQKKKRTTEFNDSVRNRASETDYEQGIINSEFLRELLKVLTDEEREIVTLHAVTGLKHREIARLLEKPLSTVLSKYNRALKKLREEGME